MYHHPEALFQDRMIAMPARAGETLFIQGDPCDEFIEIRRGVARAVNHSRDGNRQVMALFFPGDMLGLPLARDHRYSAEAVNDLLYVRHSPSRWHTLLSRMCREENRLLDAVWGEEQSFLVRSLILGRTGMLSRMAAFILMTAGKLPQSDGVLQFALPQTDIASYLATSPETVCRSLRQLREYRIIAMPRRDRLKILAPDRLAIIAEGA